MDMFKRNLAPISNRAWSEIEERAKLVLLSRLSARKVVSVNGPHGLDYTVLSEGRLSLVDDKSAVKAGIYNVLPLTEARVRFTLNKWELDNLERGAKDIDFDSLDKALDQLALFEENAVYHGYAPGTIKGLKESSAHKTLGLTGDTKEFLAAIGEGVILLKDSFVDGPYSLIVSNEVWVRLHKEAQGQSLKERVERIIGGEIVLASAIKGAILVPHDSADLELTIGQDFELGYESHDTKEVTLFATESFTFRVIEPKAIVVFK
ncbi:MAG: Maritimacin [Spirochaetes bacterium ADurb.Bin315]|jgi:uncharacterized linocin/CFP29 family protein|nr:bacteriocin family protein [Spirochaetales bacterium]OQA41069.1 MAG: Maritimacin [Spirochaetes bacterium ADurb.Bin315]